MLAYEKYKFKFFFCFLCFYSTSHFCNLFTVFAISSENKGIQKEGKEAQKEYVGGGEKYLDRRRDHEICWEEWRLNMYTNRERRHLEGIKLTKGKNKSQLVKVRRSE